MQFQDIIGQEEAKQHILEMIQHERMPHAQLLVGADGVGKFALAHAIAQYVNCANPSETDSCGKCPSCTKIAKGIHPDLHYVLPIISRTSGGRKMLTEDFFHEFRAQFFQAPYFGLNEWQGVLGGENKQLMIGVHEVRALKGKVYLKAYEAKVKVMLIWHAELMNVQAANAFLKLLEEPPANTLILMTCSQPRKLLATINSRCQRLLLRRVETSAIAHYLQEKRQLNPERADEIARIAEGSISNANAFLQEGTQVMNELYVTWLRLVYQGNYAKITEHLQQVYDASKEFQKLFLIYSVKKLRDSFLFAVDSRQLALATSEEQMFHQNFAKLLTADKVEKMAYQIEESRRYISGNANVQMVFSVLSIKLFGILRGK